MSESESVYVSRGGLKLAGALKAFGIDLHGAVCADLGCSTGGFTDCMLQHGAAHVYAVDTAYGQLAWKLRQDERVTVLERTNALHFDPATIEGFAGCDLVTIDMSWTRQQHALPAALRWVRRDAAGEPTGRIISLIKPHYEQPRDANAHQRGRRGKPTILDEPQAQAILEATLASLPTFGVEVAQWIASPIRGGARGGQGNVEYLALLVPR